MSPLELVVIIVAGLIVGIPLGMLATVAVAFLVMEIWDARDRARKMR